MKNKVVIRNVNETFIKIDCDNSILYELNDNFAFRVPGAEFSPQYRARLWNGMIYLFSLKTNQLYRGLTDYVIEFCESREYDWEYYGITHQNAFSLNEAEEFIQTLNIPNNITPRDYQIHAFTHCIRSKRALLLSPTASGKSLIIYLILRYLQKEKNYRKSLIIVPTTSLVSQLAKDFEDYGYDSSYIHKIYSGQEKDTEKPIVISTWQSLYKMPRRYFEQFDSVFGDECHLFKAKSLTDIMINLTKASYRIGTTGTLDGTKTHKLVLEGLFGPVKKVTTTKELMDQKHIADFEIKCLILKHSDVICQAAKNFTYQQEIEYLVLSQERNQFISNLGLSLNGNTLILYQYVDKHGKILHEMINSKITDDRKVFFVYGKTDVDTREEVRQIVDSHPEKNSIVFEFENKKVICHVEDDVLLTNKTTKKAKDINENDDIDDGWILNRVK